MKILVVNAGSSSLKYQLFDMDTGAVTFAIIETFYAAIMSSSGVFCRQ